MNADQDQQPQRSAGSGQGRGRWVWVTEENAKTSQRAYLVAQIERLQAALARLDGAGQGEGE